MSYSSYKSSYRGGRGGGGGYGSRGGGYRGSRGDSKGGTWATSGGGSRGRGGSGYSSGPRGRSGGFWEKEGGSSYESRRYSEYGGSSDRYSSRGAAEDSYGRRYSRQGSPLYGSREHNHRDSPDPPRKRMRSDSSYQGSSLRRTHEDSFGSANDYSNRSYGGYGGSSEDKGASGGSYGERSRVYREDRARSRSNDFQLRKVMGPPSGPHRQSSPRGSFRGRRSFRGSRFQQTRLRLRDMFPVKFKKGLLASSYSIRKKDYLRRLKLYKLKRLADRLRREKEDSGDKEEKKKSDSKINGDDGLDDDDEVEVEEEVETSVEEEEEEDEENAEEGEEEDGELDEKERKKNGIKKEDDDEEELEEGETHEDGEVTSVKKKPKKKIVRKKVVKIVKKKIKKEKPSPVKKRSKEVASENEDSKDNGVHESESRVVNEVRRNFVGRPFIHLDCKHCNIHCVTFKEYNLHLRTTKHMISMRRVAMRLRRTLAQMRIEQRKEQRILDEGQKDNPHLRTFFCSVCKLNHRSLKSDHMASARHRKMKEFLMPYCRVCHVTLRSPMGYENHLCEIEHIKRAAKLEFDKRKIAEKEDTGRNVDMDNFMILDSVGSPEESEDEGSGKEEGDKEATGDGGDAGTEEKKEKKKKKKREIKLGLEYCTKVEVVYCDLCNIYLPRNQSQEKAIAQHCRTRIHLERLVRVNKLKHKRRTHHAHSKSKDDAKDEKANKEGNEKGEKQDNKEGDKSAGSEMETSSSTLSPNKKKEKSNKDSELEEGDIDEKLWSEVDKDLGELLREVEPETKTSDEDEDHEEKGRYDRFKLSEKEKSIKKGDGNDDDDKQINKKKSETGLKPTAKKVEDEVDEEEEEEEEDEDDDPGKEKSKK